MISVAYLSFFAPALIIALWGMVLLLLEAFLELTPRMVASLAIGGLLVTALISVLYTDSSTVFWGGMCKWDGAARFFNLFFLIVTALVIWMGDEVQSPVSHDGGEFVILPLFVASGLMILASANDFIMLFIALELVTISFYILVAYQRRSIIALEAGVKYLILGGLSAAFLVMGVAYIFGVTGCTRFDLIWRYFHLYDNTVTPGLGLGLLLVLTGIGFKVAMVPFHSWAPDVYEGAPNSITAFLSVGSKAGGLIILMRVVLGVFDVPTGSAIWVPLLTFCAIASLLLGNLAAIPQRNVKRMLGYSSIGHTGFILVAIIGASATLTGKFNYGSPDSAFGQLTVSVYLVSYLLATFTCFIVLAVLERRLPGLEIHHFAGLSQRSPILAAAFSLALVSLAGVPPLSGFIAKLYVIIVAVHGHLFLLLFFTIFSAVAAFYYYLGPIKAMYWSEPHDKTPILLDRATTGMLTVMIVLIIGTGFWAQSFAIANGATTLTASTATTSPLPVAQVSH